MKLSDTQLNDLARPLVSILMKFYEDSKKEEDFKKWLLNVEKQKKKTQKSKSS